MSLHSCQLRIFSSKYTKSIVFYWKILDNIVAMLAFYIGFPTLVIFGTILFFLIKQNQEDELDVELEELEQLLPSTATNNSDAA